MAERVIDLISDTHTKPTPEMRRAMAGAEVGSSQDGEDPTVNQLEAVVAELLGHEAAIFVPSGTMANQIAIRIHCRPGDAILAHPTAHTFNFEANGPAVNAGVSLQPLDGPRGQYRPDQIEAIVGGWPAIFSRLSLVWVEQTANLAGGSIWPVEVVQEVLETAHGLGLASHLDGARLLNAAVATGLPARAFAEGFDSAWIDLTKGLGAPMGAVLAGSGDFIGEAWRVRQQFGGGLRQAGIVAAGGLYALDHHVERLADEHANARSLAIGLAELPGLEIDPTTVETNIVWVRVTGSRAAAEIVTDFEDRGVRVSSVGDRIRAVTHLDVDAGDIERTLVVAREVMRADASQP